MAHAEAKQNRELRTCVEEAPPFKKPDSAAAFPHCTVIHAALLLSPKSQLTSAISSSTFFGELQPGYCDNGEYSQFQTKENRVGPFS